MSTIAALIVARNELRAQVIGLKTDVSKLDYKETGKRQEIEFKIHDAEALLCEADEEVRDLRTVERQARRAANKAARAIEAQQDIDAHVAEAKEAMKMVKAVISDPELKADIAALMKTVFAEAVLPVIELLGSVTLPVTTVRISELEETLARAMITAMQSERELLSPPHA